jgi:carboxypeptidase Q
MMKTTLLLFVSVAILAEAHPSLPNGQAGPDSLSIVGRYEEVAGRIVAAALSDSTAWERLAYMCDTFGPRLGGSGNQERALDWFLSELGRDGFENVHGEGVLVPKWVRNSESLEMIEPWKRKVPISGLGGSIGTGARGITAEAFVVNSFEELHRRSNEARGKIVVYNFPYTGYGETVKFRTRGAIEAARAGAVASLTRSITSMSLQTPHTGSMKYADSIPRIPHAAITPEDAAMFQRMNGRGQKIVLHLTMNAETYPDAPSRNIIAEIPGREKPGEFVVLGGHSDSWDAGQGAHDDAGGCIAAWRAMTIIRKLGLQPRRTIRLVLWTNEENGVRGSLAYPQSHKNELPDHILAIEADAGIFKPKGFQCSGSDSAVVIVKRIAALLASLRVDTVSRGDGGVDIGPLVREGIPGLGLSVQGADYFRYHHSDADTVDKVDPGDLNMCAAALAVMAFVAADLPERIPR